MKRPKFKMARPRAELIASHAYATTPPPEAPAADAPDSADATVEQDIATAKSAIASALEAQGKDLDPNDPEDKAVLDGLEAAAAAIDEAAGAQGEDDEEEPVTAADIPADMACGRDGCGHLASAHSDTDTGANMGACATCDCSAMVASSLDDADSAGEMAALDSVVAPGAPTPGAPDTAPAEEGGGSPDLNEPPAMPANDAVMGPAFTIPVAIIEGQPTGDDRSIAVGALDWRVPPLPLMLLATATHDPMGMDMNAPAVLAGRIDSLERAPGEGDTQIIVAKGFCLDDENGRYLASLCEQMGRLGVSADVAVEESVMEITEIDADGFPMEMVDELTKGTIMAVTACPMPAFEGAYMVLGDGSEIPEPIPQQAEGEPAVTAAAPIHWMTYQECEPCEQGLDVLTAAGGPAKPPKAWFENPAFVPGDGRLVQILGSAGEEKYACPLTVTEDGRVFGHIAPWDVCHTGKPGCVTAPPSASGYAHFMRGQHIETAEGEKVRVGVITADTAHASVNVNALGALRHYEDTGLCAADVAAGEDEYGIWVAGALRPGVTDAQIRNLTSTSLSGDWRHIGGQLELVAALAVPLPGFPLVVVDHAYGERTAVTAAGARIMHAIKHPAAETHEYVMPDSTQRALERLARNDARSRMATIAG